MGYSGGFAEPIASGARIVSRKNHPELGSLLKAISESTGNNDSVRLIEAPPSVKQEVLSKLEALLDRYHKIPKEQYRKWLRGEAYFIDELN